MADHPSELLRTLEELTRRLDRIERHLGLPPTSELPPPAKSVPPLAPPIHPPTQHSPSTSPARPTTEPSSPDHAAGSTAPLAARLAERRRQRDLDTVTPTSAPTATVPDSSGESTSAMQGATSRPSAIPSGERPRAGSRRGGDGGGLEAFLGMKAAAWIGAIIVVLGAAFAIREFATGFWANLPTWGQALLVALGGAALLALGEFAHRRIGRFASVGLMGAGLGVLYLDAYASFAWFEPAIVTRESAFALMGVVAAIGFAITVRTRLLTIGVLALVGGYLTPIVLAGGRPQPLLLGGFLTMLFGIALALSAALAKPFRALRYVALGGQLLLGIVFVDVCTSGQWMIAMVMLSIWWAMVMAESVLAALRGQSTIGNIAACLVMTLGYITLGGWSISAAGPGGAEWLGAFLLSVGILSAATALHFGPGLEGLRGRLTSAMDRLAAALWALGGALLVAAIGFQFDGAGQSIGWLALALAGVESGRRLPSRGVTVFALLTGALAIARIVAIDSFDTTLRTAVSEGSWYALSQWSLLALGGIIATVIAAWRVGEHRGGVWRSVPIALTVLSVALWCAWCALTLSGLAITTGWLLGVAALLAVERIGPRQRVVEIGIVALLATGARWLLIDAVAARLDPAWEATATTPVLNGQMALALAIATGGWWVVRLLRQRMRSGVEGASGNGGWSIAWQIALLFGGAFLLVGFSFEIDRIVLRMAERGTVSWSTGHVRHLLWTTLWTVGVSAVGLIATRLLPREFRRPLLLLRAAWLMMLLLSGKWMLYDTFVWSLELGQTGVASSWTLANLQLLAGLVLAATAVLLVAIGATPGASDRAEADGARSDGWSGLTAAAPVLAAMVVLWGLTFEVDRWLLQRLDRGAVVAWPLDQWRALWWTALWAAGAAAMAAIGWWRRVPVLSISGGAIIVGAAALWLTYDTIYWRLDVGPAEAPVLMNLQFAVGLGVAVALLALSRYAKTLLGADRERGDREGSVLRRTITAIALGLVAAIGLWLGSLEIDRSFADQPMARQMGWSVYWSLFALALVMVGFVRPSAASRYAGLALLAIVVAKVLLVDLSQVEQVWRVISFIASGLLLIGTSIAYARLAPRAGAEKREHEPRGNQETSASEGAFAAQAHTPTTTVQPARNSGFPPPTA